MDTNVLVTSKLNFNSYFDANLFKQAALKACEILLEKMAPVKASMKDPTWEKVVSACYGQNMLLTAQYQ